MLGFGPVEFSCRFSSFGPTFMRNMWFDDKPKLERKKTSPKSPMQIAQDKQPADQNKKQNASYEGRRRAAWPVGTTVQPWWQPRPGRGGCHGPWWLFPFPAASVLCDASVFHAMPFQLLLVFAFKGRMNLVHMGQIVHRIAFKNSLKNLH